MTQTNKFPKEGSGCGAPREVDMPKSDGLFVREDLKLSGNSICLVELLPGYHP
jgi:hypothetical protein